MTSLFPYCRLQIAVVVATVSFTVLMLSTKFATAESDFDKDGLSDLILVQQAEGKLSWSAFLSSQDFSTSPAALSNSNVGTSNPFVGYWVETDRLDTGAVSVEEDRLLWEIKSTESTMTLMRAFGTRGDTLLSGGDFDGNGITDLARIAKGGLVEIYLNPFATSSYQRLNVSSRLARRGIPFFYQESTTVPRDEIGFFIQKGKKRKRSTSLVTVRQTGEIVTVDWEVKLPEIKRVQPIKQSDGSDSLILFFGSSQSTYQIRDVASGMLRRRGALQAKQSLAVGNYMSEPGEEVAIISPGATIQLLNPFSETSKEVRELPASSVVVDQFSIGLFSSAKKDDQQSNSQSGLARACPGGVQRVATGILWKPEADAKLGSPRSGKPVVLFQNSKPGANSIDIYASNGQTICTAGFKASDEPGVNCGAEHYYVGWSGGCGNSGGGIAAAARKAAGSDDIYVKGRGGVCFGPIDPGARTGGLGC